jgi:hypothetical protein
MSEVEIQDSLNNAQEYLVPDLPDVEEGQWGEIGGLLTRKPCPRDRLG